MSSFFCILSILIALICDSYGAKQVRTLNRDRINAIVNKHNEYRRKVAKGNMNGHPRASNMIELQWDDALAWSAANWAGTCPGSKHDTYAARKDRFKRARKFKNSFEPYNGGDLGQNMGSINGWNSDNSISNLEGRIKQFIPKESPRINFANSMNYGKAPCSMTPYSTKCGHFTQGVWAKTKYVGCGLVTGCGNTDYTLVCNYFPEGNIMWTPVYKKGSPASDCPSGWRTRRNGLCGQSGGAFTLEEDAEAEANAKLSAGLILGIAGAAAVALIVVLIVCYKKKKKTHKVITKEMEMEAETVLDESGEDEEEEIGVEEQETIEITV